MPISLLANRLHDTCRDTPKQMAVPCGLDSASHSIPQSSPPLLPTLQLHVWLEIKWHYFQLACVLFRFELSASDLVSCIYVNIWFVLCDCAILSDSCVYIASIFQNDLCHEPLITVCIITDLLWVEVLALCCSQTNVLFHWLREPVTSVPDTRHRTPVYIISWTVLHYSYMCGWKLSDITLKWLVCFCRFWIKQVITGIVYITGMFYNNLFQQPLITLWNGIDLLWVEAPCTVLFADKCTASLVGNQYSAVYFLAS